MKFTKGKIEECAQWVRENGLVEHGGATKAKFCKAMGIAPETLRRWLMNERFEAAIKKAQCDYEEGTEHELVLTLVKVAKGYTVPKRKTEYGNRIGKNGEDIPFVKKQSVEEVYVQPNVAAAIFLLTNIAPSRWKNKMNNEVDANVKTEMNADVNARVEASLLSEDLAIRIADELQDAKERQLKEEKENGR